MKLKNKMDAVDTKDLLGDDHIGTSAVNPMRPDAFEMSDEEKMESQTKYL